MGDARYAAFLRQRYRIVLGYSGMLAVIIAGVILSPLLLLPAYPFESDTAWGFLLPGGGLAFFGAVLWRFFLPRGGESLSRSEGGVVVVLSWILAVLAGSIPFMTAGGLGFTQAVFESTSGWTTTGLTVIDVTRSSHLILLYRSLLQLAGGAGLAIIMLSALTGPAGAGLSVAEGRIEQLVPNMRQSAKLVLTLYSSYAVFGCLALRLAGMNWFDAVNHGFAAIATGGFSTRTESIGYWNSPLIEGVTICLMLLGSMNFLTSYTLLMRGRMRMVMRNGEIRLQAVVIPLAALVLFLGVTAGLYPTFDKQVRVALFEVVNALSTTGFVTVGYDEWSELGWLVIVILMLIGGGTGSTAGGLKQYRVYALYLGVRWELRRLLLPRNAVTEAGVWIGEKRRFLKDRELRQIALFAFLYLAALALGTGILAAYGYPLRKSLFEFASAMGTVGLTVGVTAADAPKGVLWAETAGMLLGRLEFFVIFLGMIKLLGDIWSMTRLTEMKKEDPARKGID